MRITIAGEVPQPEQSIRIGDLLLCSSVECYRAHTSGYLNIANTATGKAAVIADVSIPVTKITDVYFADVSSRSVVGGHLKLETPLAIEKDFPAIEFMISVRKQNNGTQTTYVPVQSASMYFTDDSEIVHYLPSVQTVAELSLGTKLTIPAGAVDRPQIFNIGITKVGEMFPKIDILPYINLKKPGNIEVPAVRTGSATHDFIVPINPAGQSEDAQTLNMPAARQTAKVAFLRTAVIEPSVLEKSLLGTASGAPNPSSATSPPKPCAEYLAQPIVLGMINLMAMQTGAVRVTACEKVKPFIHIVYVMINDSRIKFSIPYKTSTAGSGNGPYLSLQRISSFGTAPSTALINGFTWEGNLGIFEGDSGKALGIVRSNGIALGDNVVGGGATCANCATDGSKFVMAFSGDRARPRFLETRLVSDLGTFSQDVVSTSTSVIKNGACQTPGTPSRWSAVGAFNGRMVLISSTSSGQTSAAELCAVFKALAIRDALRLDGGPSASLMVSGELLNPLEGWDRTKYGMSRRIAYPLRISH
jgi:hypothetical protein